MYLYKFSKQADGDIEKSYDYYESKQNQLGKEFVQEVFNSIKSFENKPEKNPADSDGIRKAKLKKFPFYIYYVFQSPMVLIIAIWHIARLPFSSKDRLDTGEWLKYK